MLIKEIISRKLTIVNPVAFAENKYHNTMAMLNKEYVGRCFEDGYIVNILDENLEMSNIEIMICDNKCKGVMDVKFTVEKNTFPRGYMFLATITEIKEKIIKLSCEFADIFVKESYMLNNRLIDLTSLKINQMVPILVNNKCINVAATKAVIDGQILIPYPISYVFVATGELSGSLELNRMINYAEKLQNDIKKMEGDTKYNFILNFLYPYKTNKSMEIDKTKKQTIMNIANGSVKPNRIIKDARINWAVDPCVVVDDSEELPPDFNGKVVTFPIEKIVIMLLSNQIFLAEIMLEMLKKYTDDDIKKNDALWKLK